MEYAEEFRSLSECVAYLRERYRDERLSEGRDIDTGKSFRGARFPRWLFRGERSCFPASRPTLWRLRRSGDHLADEVERGTDFAVRYTVHHLVLPYIQDLDHFTSLTWMAVSATYEGLAFCQHYGLPTAMVDFTLSLRIAAAFASTPTSSASGAGHGRIAVLDTLKARECSQIIDLRDFSATRAARQKGFALYVPGHADLCSRRVQRKLGLKWYRFNRDAREEAQWQKGFGAMIRTDNDRLAGWLRHAVSIYARQVGPLSNETADYLCGRIPIVPLVAQSRRRPYWIAFQVPSTVPFETCTEAKRTMRDWTRDRTVDQGRRFTVYRHVPGTELVRFVGT